MKKLIFKVVLVPFGETKGTLTAGEQFKNKEKSKVYLEFATSKAIM